MSSSRMTSKGEPLAVSFWLLAFRNSKNNQAECGASGYSSRGASTDCPEEVVSMFTPEGQKEIANG